MKRGFTFTELLIVLAILGFVISVAPVGGGEIETYRTGDYYDMERYDEIDATVVGDSVVDYRVRWDEEGDL